MKIFLRLLISVAAAAVGCLAIAQSPAPGVRTWKTVEGQSFQATLLKVRDSLIELRLPNGQSATFPIARLSPDDQAFLKGTPVATPAATPSATPAKAPTGTPVEKAANRLPPEKRTWPAKVEVDSRAVEVKAVSESASDRKYVYRSQAFEFAAEDKLAGSVMKEIARTFEATRALVEALPWDIEPKPPVGQQYYKAYFYVTRESYIAAGGPANSGGVYMRRNRAFHVPFQSLGLEMRGKTWFKNENYRNDTIVHEITHMMMHDYLPFLPIWAIEGSAEYTEMLPYNAGRFLTDSHERGIKTYLKEAGERGLTLAAIGSVYDHMNLTSDAWYEKSAKGSQEQHRLYVASCLLVYYFCHLDGDGKGTRFFKYLDKMREARDAWAEFFQNPRVTLNQDGSFRYPSDVPLPSQVHEEKYGLEQLGILMDGRDREQMQKAVVEGFKKIGVRW